MRVTFQPPVFGGVELRECKTSTAGWKESQLVARPHIAPALTNAKAGQRGKIKKKINNISKASDIVACSSAGVESLLNAHNLFTPRTRQVEVGRRSGSSIKEGKGITKSYHIYLHPSSSLPVVPSLNHPLYTINTTHRPSYWYTSTILIILTTGHIYYPPPVDPSIHRLRGCGLGRKLVWLRKQALEREQRGRKKKHVRGASDLLRSSRAGTGCGELTAK